MKPMKPMAPLEPIIKGSRAARTWWPKELGDPSVSGSSNDLRYAFFADKQRLAVDDRENFRLYDTGDSRISGFRSSDGQTLTFETADGVKKLGSLRLLP